MSKRKTDVIENFGERLAQSARPADYTQLEFAAEVGITPRMRGLLRGTERAATSASAAADGPGAGRGADVLLGMTQPRKVKRLAANAVCSFRSVANRLAVRVAEPGVCVIFQFLQGADPS